MRPATLRTAGGTAAVRVMEDIGIETGHADYAPLIPAPGKILCVGLNYREHILEMGRELGPPPARQNRLCHFHPRHIDLKPRPLL